MPATGGLRRTEVLRLADALQKPPRPYQVWVMKTEFQKRREARERAARALSETKKRLGLGSVRPLRGVTRDPLAATSWERKPKTAPTSDRIPGSAPATNLMHDHKWKRGAQESEATLKEIRRKASRIAPAYNKGALQYLPDE
jgi:hypothetical protein